MQSGKRYVITGTGAIAPGAINKTELRKNLLEQKTFFETRTFEHYGEMLGGFCPTPPTNGPAPTKETLFNYRAALTVAEAIISANLKNQFFEGRDDILIIAGTEAVDRTMEESMFEAIRLEQKIKPVNYIYDTVSNVTAGYLNSYLKTNGPSFMVGGACSSANLAIRQACMNMTADNLPMAIVTNLSNCSQTLSLKWGFNALRITSRTKKCEDYCGPLDLNRNGIILSEGCGAFIIEELEHAKKRKAPILAEIISSAHLSDSESPVKNTPEIIEKVVRKSLDQAKLNEDQIDLVSLHTTGTYEGDINEMSAMKNVFKSNKTFFNNSKGHLGHTMAACGALEIIGNLESLQDGLLHPCASIKEIDEKCYHPGILLKKHQMKQRPEYFLNFNAGLRGINTALILKRWSDHESS